MKGIILAGGNGTRLSPLTVATNKHLLPVYKKPMIFYPLQVLIDCGIKEILIVTSSEHINSFYKLLGSGEDLNVNIQYQIQGNELGTGAALLCGESFSKGEDVMVILGDNIIYQNIKDFVTNFESERKNFDAKVLITKVDNPEGYGVVEFNGDKITKLVEKPEVPFSNFVNTGLWIFKDEIFEECKRLKLSQRSEYEITDVLAQYAENGKLTYKILDSEWTDAGTFEQLYKATILMQQLEESCEDQQELIDDKILKEQILSE